MKRQYSNFSLHLTPFSAYSQSSDCEEIERKDEYIGYGTNTSQKDILKVFPFINASFRIHKYSQPSFVKFYFTG